MVLPVEFSLLLLQSTVNVLHPVVPSNLNLICSTAIIPLLPVYEAMIVGMTGFFSSTVLFSPGFQKGG